MKDSRGGFSLFDFLLVVILLGIFTYIAVQWYYRWAEKFQAQEAAIHLKVVKNQIEICLISKASPEATEICLFSPGTQNSNIIHFKCCDGINYTGADNQPLYGIYATRNDVDIALVDVGGDQPSCKHGDKPKENMASGIILCRNTDGTHTIEGWGLYKGIYQ